MGQYDKSNDSGSFANSVISQALKSNSFNVPAAKHVEGFADKLPYVSVVYEELSMKRYQMHSYPGKNLTENH